MSRRKAKAEPTANELRDAVLKRMGPMDGIFYPEGAAKMLDAYVAKVREAWTFCERLEIERRYRDAVLEVMQRPVPLRG